MRRRVRRNEIPDYLKKLLKSAAEPDCKECDGEGWTDVSYNNNPDTVEEACKCAEHALPPADYDPRENER